MPQIFIQSLADYNAGRLVGQWVSLEGMSEDDLWDAVKAVLAMSKEPKAEEWEIADYDGFYGLTPGLHQVLDIARLLEEHGEAYALYVQWVGEAYSTEDDFEDRYCGVWPSFKDYAVDLFDELYLAEFPKHLHFYIDYDAWARDLEINDYHWDSDSTGDVHIFRC